PSTTPARTPRNRGSRAVGPRSPAGSVGKRKHICWPRRARERLIHAEFGANAGHPGSGTPVAIVLPEGEVGVLPKDTQRHGEVTMKKLSIALLALGFTGAAMAQEAPSFEEVDANADGMISQE